MALLFNGAPYWDDYDQTKGFLKVLFRPGYAVQARELTQSQDILQNQIGRFGSYIFKSGSQVTGGQITLDTNVVYANLQSQYQNTAINLTQFANTIITDANTRTIRAAVLQTVPQITGLSNPPTLMLKYLTGTTFPDGANVTIESSNSGPYATLVNSNSQGAGSLASIRDGIFYIDLDNLATTSNSSANTVPSVLTNGYFVRVPPQTIVIDTYDNTPSARVGLQIGDVIVTEQTDPSLLDPALGASNYQAPGATRYQINATLSTRSLISQDDSAFVELLRVANGVIQNIQTNPVLSEINDTLAQRTYDQSGDFTVNPFTITLANSANNDSANANTQQYYTILNSGLAYVQGYRYQTVAKTILSAPRARTFANVASYKIQDYYGNYFLVSNVKGEFNISALPAVDIHCVSGPNIATANNFVYANTKLGTAYVRAFEYVSASNPASAQTHVYRNHLFHLNTGSISSNTVSSTTNTITFGPLFSNVANAYLGMTITIPSTGDNRIITNYVGTTQTATVSSNWSSNPSTGSLFTLIGDIASAESLVLSTNSAVTSDINIGSKNLANTYQYAFLTDTNFQPLIFPFPDGPIAQGLQSPSYQYRYKVASNQTLSNTSPLVITLTITGDSSASFTAAGISGSDLIALSDFLVVTNPATGSGQIVPMVASLGRSISTTTTTATFTMGASDATINNVDIFASVNTTIAAKIKTLVSASTTLAISGGTSVGGATVYLTQGQVAFVTPTTTNLVLPGVLQDLYISDVISIVAIIDSGAIAQPVTQAMVTAAVNNQTMPGTSLNITSNYSFNNGQRDTYYDHANITLNSGYASPKGQVLVLLNYYSPSTSGAYFSVDSYPNYSNIPNYQTLTTNQTYGLGNCLDFRPVRDAATTNFTFTNAGPIFLPEPIPGDAFTVGFGYYLGRYDKLVLTKDGIFKIIQGTSSINPLPPPTPAKAMLLYTLTVPPYTFHAANVSPEMVSNKRYTMKDIGTLDKRISTLEYYTTLNALEQSATTQLITDNNGLARPKNGILVDNFQGSSVAAVTDPAYNAAIDSQNQQLRSSYTIKNVNLTLNSGLSSNYQKSGKIYTLPFTTITLIDQPTASRLENINPFGITSWVGTMKLDPESDTWISVQKVPVVVQTNNSAYDNWVAQGSNAIYTAWNAWQTIWSGTQVISSVTQNLFYPNYGYGQDGGGEGAF